MTDATAALDLLTRRLTDPWPDSGHAITRRCAQIMDILDNDLAGQDGMSQQAGTLLTTLSDRAWWELWLYAQRSDHANNMHDVVNVEMKRRRPDLLASPTLAHEIMHRAAPEDETAVWRGLIRSGIQNGAWTTHDPQEIAAYMTRLLTLAQELHLRPEHIERGLDGVWNSLSHHRGFCDTPQLERASEHIWNVLPTTTRPSSWATLVMCLLDNPSALKGVFSMDNQPRAAHEWALSDITKTAPTAHPADPKFVAELAHRCSVAAVREALEAICTEEHDADWTRDTVAILMPLGQWTATDGECRASLIRMCAALGCRGLTQQLTTTLAAAQLTPDETCRVVEDMVHGVVHPSWPRAFGELMSACPPSNRPDLIGAVCDTMTNDQVSWHPTIAKAVAETWSSITTPQAVMLIQQHPMLVDVPHVRAWSCHQELSANVETPKLPPSVKKM